MADDGTRLHNFRLDSKISDALGALARNGHTTLTQAVRDILSSYAALWRAGLEQQREALATLVDRVGRDGYLVVFVDADADGNPNVTIAGYKPGENKGFFEGLKGVGHIDGDKCHVFLDFGELAPDPMIIGVGDDFLRVPCAQMSLGPVSWPPNDYEFLRLPLNLMLPEVKEDAADETPAEAEAVES